MYVSENFYILCFLFSVKDTYVNLFKTFILTIKILHNRKNNFANPTIQHYSLLIKNSYSNLKMNNIMRPKQHDALYLVKINDGKDSLILILYFLAKP